MKNKKITILLAALLITASIIPYLAVAQSSDDSTSNPLGSSLDSSNPLAPKQNMADPLYIPPVPKGPDSSGNDAIGKPSNNDSTGLTLSQTPAERQAAAKALQEECTGSLTKPGDEKKCEEMQKAADSEAAAEKAAADKAAAEAEKTASEEEYCTKTFDKSCALHNTDLENACKAKGYASCAEYDQAMKNLGGTGFKLNLDSLTLTSNGQKSGSAIFQNKDYAKYGIVLGTILRVIDIMVFVIGSLAMLTMIIAGIFMITNHGEQAWIDKGKTMMLYSILGVLVSLLSFVIVNIIETALA